MNIGKVFKESREDAGLSQRALASQLGLTPAALWKIENGLSWPKKSTIDKFCGIMKMPIAMLYTSSFEREDYS